MFRHKCWILNTTWRIHLWSVDATFLKWCRESMLQASHCACAHVTCISIDWCGFLFPPPFLLHWYKITGKLKADSLLGSCILLAPTYILILCRWSRENVEMRSLNYGDATSNCIQYQSVNQSWEKSSDLYSSMQKCTVPAIKGNRNYEIHTNPHTVKTNRTNNDIHSHLIDTFVIILHLHISLFYLVKSACGSLLGIGKSAKPFSLTNVLVISCHVIKFREAEGKYLMWHNANWRPFAA